jgi:acetylornithine deacetylase
MKDIGTIASLEFPETSEWLPEPGAQVTMISGGTKHNMVPDRCKYVVDVRSNDRYGNEEILAMLRKVCAADLVPRSTRLKPSVLEGNHFLMEAILTSGLSPFGSSTLSDMSLIPYPAIKMGPGDSARSHTAGEYILAGELDQGVVQFNHFLQAVARVVMHKGKAAMMENNQGKRS